MLRLAFKNLRANLSRLIAMVTAVVAGIAFLAAGLMLTDAVRVALLGGVEDQYQSVDLAVVPADQILATLSGGDSTSALNDTTLAAVRSVSGVKAAAPERTVDVQLLTASDEAVSARTQGRPWISDDALNPLALVAGRAPRTANEVVIDRGLAEKAGLKVGSSTRLATPIGPLKVQVAGLSAFGRNDAIDAGGTISFPESAAGEVLGGGAISWSRILVRTSGDTAAITAAISKQLGEQVGVIDGAALIESEQQSSAAFIGLLRPVLQAFALLSLLVCGFVIFNTFSVVVTQRFRELALIRAIGGTPAQVRRSLMLEGLGIGLLASALGIAVGALLSIGLQSLLSAIDIPLPGAGVKVTSGTVVLCMIVGTLVTVASVAVPAFRAGRTKPVEAMRSAAVDRTGSSPVRLVVGGLLLATAIGLLIGAKVGAVPKVLLGAGTSLLFTGLVVGGPLLARVFSKVLSVPMRVFGLTGRLAADNCARNPKRTATTANALVIGLFLVTLVTVSGTAVKKWSVEKLNTLSGSDYIVSSNAAVPDSVVKGILATDGVAGAAAVRVAVVNDSAGIPQIISTTDFDQLATTSGIKLSSGSLDEVANGEGVAVVDLTKLLSDLVNSGSSSKSTDSSETNPLDTSPPSNSPSSNNPPNDETTALPPGTFGTSETEVGSTVEVPSINGGSETLTVAAVLNAKLDALTLGYLVGPATFERLVGEQPVRQVFIRVEPGKAEAVGLSLERLTRQFTTVDVQPGNFIGQAVGTIFDFLINAVNALLAMSLLIALIGIVNTMTLSIIERRQELGMVRALGMTRGQVGAMVGLEALMLGFLGTLIGVGTGLFLGWILIGSLDSSISLGVDWGRVALIAAAGCAAGALASILPTRRATKVDVLAAMQAT